MRNELLILLFVFSAITKTSAQVGIGTNSPDASAELELSSTSKGFLPTRIALTAINVAAPVTSPASGLLVYNTATAGVSPNNVIPGYYYWNGNGWIKVAIGNGSMQAGDIPGQIQYWNGTQWIFLSPGTYGQALIMCNGVPTWGGCLPVISKTVPIYNIQIFDARSGDTLINDGGTKTQTGVCYSTSPNPTIANSIAYGGSSLDTTNIYTANMNNLNPSTTYYVRAFATNSTGTVYANELSFTTQADFSTPHIMSATPNPVAVGDTLTITGSGFVSGMTTVQFVGASASANFMSTTQITVVVPASAVTGYITVGTNNGQSNQYSITIQ